MSVIRVNPDSIRAYGVDAQQRFASIRADLEALTREVVTVRYIGPNAVAFKTQCGELAATFSHALLVELGQIAEAVRASTSNISAALGGQSLQLSVDGSPIVVPGVDGGDGSVDIDTSALEALKPVVSARFGSLEEALSQHLNRLQGTDWQGQAKEGAVASVSGFTTSARSRAQDAQASITQTIDRQIASVLVADR